MLVSMRGVLPCNSDREGSFCPCDTDHNRCLGYIRVPLKEKDAYANRGNKEYACPCCTECKHVDV